MQNRLWKTHTSAILEADKGLLFPAAAAAVDEGSRPTSSRHRCLMISFAYWRCLS